MVPNWLKVERVALELARLPRAFSGFRMAQISDIHMGGWMNLARLQQVAEVVAAQGPDVLLITGDFLFGHRFTKRSRQAIQDLIRVLSPLAASLPSFAVLGNHDYWTDREAVRDMLCRSGVTELTNAVFSLRRGDAVLHLCGLDDIRHGEVRLDEIIAHVRDEEPAVLLVHEPDFADISAATGKFDLQVSGHTHGGQIVLPLVGPPVLPLSGRKYPSGLYRVRDMFQYTNRGVGVDRMPIRWNCPAEITLFELQSPAD